MEDLGAVIKKKKAAGVRTIREAAPGGKPRPMVTPKQHASLTKEGYKIIGTHSAVKLCRWTKAMLRGRGGCYKHTCYGITSYQCMEATPSLACANKCVFCWRHHKNPVGREWRWETDNPEFLVKAAIEKHQEMIKECRGVPGVIPARLEAAMQVAHCALSLVGEPIIYPYISECPGRRGRLSTLSVFLCKSVLYGAFVWARRLPKHQKRRFPARAVIEYLHDRRISTFLVTNAQFPEAITTLAPVTQLYVRCLYLFWCWSLTNVHTTNIQCMQTLCL
jgi:tRNA wybutosine-synthesizing protein 1